MAQAEQLGFIGLGIMGYPMAEHLLKAGHALTVFNRNRAKAEQLAKHGASGSEPTSEATVAASPAEVGRRATIIFLCVGDTQAVEEVCGSLLQGAQPGSVVVDS